MGDVDEEIRKAQESRGHGFGEAADDEHSTSNKFAGFESSIGTGEVEEDDGVWKPRHPHHALECHRFLQVSLLDAPPLAHEPRGVTHLEDVRAAHVPVGEHAGDEPLREIEHLGLLADHARQPREQRVGGDEEDPPPAEGQLLEKVGRLAHREERRLRIDYHLVADAAEEVGVACRVRRAHSKAQE